MTTLLVTGTGTGVGKTVVTAAIAALAAAQGQRVTVVKPVQTGEPPGTPGDVGEVCRLAGPVPTVELRRYPDPLSPEAAARQAGRPALAVRDCIDAVEAAGRQSDLVLVEGAGGLLVRYAGDGWTAADAAVALRLPVVLVTEAGLGTLNATALTVEAMQARALSLHALVIGAWPADPGLAERCNLVDLSSVAGRALSGALPDRAAALSPEEFLVIARAGLDRSLGGDFDVAAFTARQSP